MQISNFQFPISNHKRIFAAGGLVVVVALVTVLGLTVMRVVQNQKPTVTLPKAAGGSCTGTGYMEIGSCGGHWKCNGSTDQSNCPCGCGRNIDGNNDSPPCRSSFDNYKCWSTADDNKCHSATKVDCGSKTDQSSCQAVSGCSWSGTSTGVYTAVSPVGGATVGSLTPTFSWTGPSGLSYQVICVGAYADGHPPGSCNFVNCTADFGPSVSSYTMATPLLPNTDYRWLVYGQPGSPAPGTGCQQFRTPAAAATYYSCQNKTCAVASGATANANGCTAAGGVCCASGSDCSAGQTCDTTKAPNSCVTAPSHFECVSKTCASVAGSGDNKNGCTVAGKTCCLSNADCTGGQTCNTSASPNVCACPSGQVSCGSGSNATCVNILTDSNNCGGCGRVCSSGQVCSSGSCATSCSGSTPDLCGSTCTNKQTDRSNCGTCGNACPSGQTCSAGVCTTNQTEVNSCWGNGGTNGRCLDCNGDGVINILDFSCFANCFKNDPSGSQCVRKI